MNKSLEHMLDTWEREGQTEISPRKKNSDSQRPPSTQEKVMNLLERSSSKKIQNIPMRRGSLLHIIKSPELTDNNTEHISEEDLKPLPFTKNSTNKENPFNFQERAHSIIRPIIQFNSDNPLNSASTQKNLGLKSSLKELES